MVTSKSCSLSLQDINVCSKAKKIALQERYFYLRSLKAIKHYSLVTIAWKVEELYGEAPLSVSRESPSA